MTSSSKITFDYEGSEDFPESEGDVKAETIPVILKIYCEPRRQFPDDIIKLEQFRHYFITRGYDPSRTRCHMDLPSVRALKDLMTDTTRQELEKLVETYGSIPGPLRREMLRAVENKILLENMNGDEKQQRLAMDVIKGMRTDPEIGLQSATAESQLGEGLKTLFAKLNPQAAPVFVKAEFEDVKEAKSELKQIEAPKEVKVKNGKKNKK